MEYYFYVCRMRIDGRFKKGISYSIETQFKKGQHWRERKSHWDRDWLYNKYVVEKMSIPDIAKICGCTDSNISFWMKKHDIKGRTVSEARKEKYWGLSGEDNPMWNRKGELNINWKGGITAERQSFYTSVEWKNVCSLVWKRDIASCQRCGILADNGIPIHIHHIVSFKEKEIRGDINNLILLCKICHNWVHSKKNINKQYIKTYEQYKNNSQ